MSKETSGLKGKWRVRRMTDGFLSLGPSVGNLTPVSSSPWSSRIYRCPLRRPVRAELRKGAFNPGWMLACSETSVPLFFFFFFQIWGHKLTEWKAITLLSNEVLTSKLHWGLLNGRSYCFNKSQIKSKNFFINPLLAFLLPGHIMHEIYAGLFSANQESTASFPRAFISCITLSSPYTLLSWIISCLLVCSFQL